MGRPQDVALKCSVSGGTYRDDAEAERQAAAARSRELEARIEMVVEILKYVGDDDRKHILDGALLEMSRLRLASR
jgi:hypothetical protein